MKVANESGIQLTDHLIVSKEDYFSFEESGLITKFIQRLNS